MFGNKNRPTFGQLKTLLLKQLITTLFIFIFLQPSWASLYRNYQVEDGLSHNSVWAVMQDKQGFLWFGTVDGLNRFDGNSFKIYKKLQRGFLIHRQ